MDFDRVSRHAWCGRIIRKVLPDGGSILDVGGSEGLTADHLQGYEVTVIDVDNRPGVNLIGSGTALPFRARSFDGVLALDVLEHIPEQHRSPFLGELARVAAEVVIVGGPYRTEGVADVEGSVRPIFEGLFDQDHPWLAEHSEFGLPDLEVTSRVFEESGWKVSLHQSNPLALWRELQVANFLAARVGESENLQRLHNELLDRFLDAGDQRGPAYRHFVIAARDEVRLPDPDESGQDELEIWVRHTLRAQGEVIDSAMKRLGDYEEELRSSGEVARRGWEDSVTEVARMRESASAAAQGWQETVGDVERLTRELHEAFARIQQLKEALVEAERSREALEAQVISSPESWLAKVSGPPLMVMPPQITDRDALPTSRARASADGGEQIKFSILIPVYNPEAAHLTSCLRSVREQTYPNWEMVAFDGSDAAHVAPILGRFTELDYRFKVVAGENRGISENTNRAASAASGDWFLLVDHDDLLASDALESLAAALASEPEARFVYSDEDKIDDEGRRSDPFLKPDWSPDLLRHVNYITHLQALRRDLWEEVGGLRPECDGAQDYDLALRATSRAGGALHVPEILYHWRSHELSTALDVAIKPGAHRAGRKALEDFATEHAPGATVEFGTGPTSHRLRYPLSEQQVSVIVPFRDGWKLTESCLQALHRFGSALPLEILLVNNRSTHPQTFEKVGEWKDRFPGLRVVSYDQPFNFQRLNNWAVEQTGGELLLFLNNDVEPIHEGWVEAMAEHAQRPEVGAVGARLFYPDGLVQHAGVVVGIGGYADHPWRGLGPKAWTPAGPSYWTRNFLAVTAACLMIDRSKFEDVGGFDERFVVGGGDVALGIALHERGLWNVYTPFARLLHHESVTRGTTVPKSDLEVSSEVYAPYLEGRDPFYNHNLTLWDTTSSVASEAELAEKLIPAPASR